MERKTETRILIVGPAWIGDMVTVHSLIQSLHQRGISEVDVLAPEWSAALLSRMPEVGTVISAPLAHGRLHLATRMKIGLELRERGYHRAIVIPRSFKSAIISSALRLKVPGYSHYLFDSERECLFGGLSCLRQIMVEEVLRPVEPLPQGGSRATH